MPSPPSCDPRVGLCRGMRRPYTDVVFYLSTVRGAAGAERVWRPEAAAAERCQRCAPDGGTAAGFDKRAL